MMVALDCFLALVLISSVLIKLRAPDRLAEAAAHLAGVNVASGSLVMVLAGTAEALAAAGLLGGLIRPAIHFALTVPGAVLAALVWGAYALVLWRRRGQVLDCGCDLRMRPRPVTAAQILRAGLLALLAGVAGIGDVVLSTLPVAASQSAAPAAWVTPPLAAIGFFALYLGWSEIIAIPAPVWRKS